MAVRMAALTRSKSGIFFARRVIPLMCEKRWEAQLRLPANKSAHEVKSKHGEWLAEIEIRIATLCATAKGEGQRRTMLFIPRVRCIDVRTLGRRRSGRIAQR
jgi:hypothetical protein